MSSLGTSNQRRYHQYKAFDHRHVCNFGRLWAGEHDTSAVIEVPKVTWEITNLDVDLHMPASARVLLHGVLVIKHHLVAVSCC